MIPVDDYSAVRYDTATGKPLTTSIEKWQCARLTSDYRSDPYVMRSDTHDSFENLS